VRYIILYKLKKSILNGEFPDFVSKIVLKQSYHLFITKQVQRKE